MYYVYMLRCRGDVYYTGLTVDMAHRIRMHLSGKGAKFTRSHPPEAVAALWRCGERDGLSLVRVRLYTGRSHQIRVQLAHAGIPIWGDARYGGGQSGQQIALWGAFLRLEHPTTHERMAFCAPPFAFSRPWKGFEMPEEFAELDD